MSERIAFVGIAAALAGMLFFGFRSGVMPGYLSGGSDRNKEPVLFWISAGVLSFAVAVSILGAVL